MILTYHEFDLFFTFLLVSMITLVINIVFYVYKRRGYSLNHMKLLVITSLIVSSYFLVVGLPFFILNKPTIIINSFEKYWNQILFFNLSIFFLFISLIILLFPSLDIDKSKILLEIPSFKNAKRGKIKIGRVLKGNRRRYEFSLSIKDLEKHMFICGATGTGKSNFIQNFLINFKKNYNIPFFLVEFKGEYHFLQEEIDDVIILLPGENFSLNIFNPENTNPIIHGERIFDILKSGNFLDDSSAEYSPQMEKVLVEILVNVCKNGKYQSWNGFEFHCKEYLKKNLNTIPMLKQTLISIKNRIRRFSDGPLKAIFETNEKFKIKELFKRNVILDLSSIIRLGGEKEDALFFLNMILKYLWDRNLTRGAYNFKGIRHLTIIEDAQYFAPQGLQKKNKLTSYLEDIALLQRGTGECLISLATRPNISREILANCGVLVSYQNHIEKDLMCELLNLDQEKKHLLSNLEEGEAIIRINSIKEPFLLWVPLILRDYPEFIDINNKNKKIMGKTEGRAIDLELDKKPVRHVSLFSSKISESLRKIINKIKTKIKKYSKLVKNTISTNLTWKKERKHVLDSKNSKIDQEKRLDQLDQNPRMLKKEKYRKTRKNELFSNAYDVLNDKSGKNIINNSKEILNNNKDFEGFPIKEINKIDNYDELKTYVDKLYTLEKSKTD
ncbi:MAG: ATP-binding protein [Promethearchaeota archaeon]|nr:MAG: ATP-binding protein [Candidatus Lokiarchaeota archaeon]